jgi:hypothetical protein
MSNLKEKDDLSLVLSKFLVALAHTDTLDELWDVTRAARALAERNTGKLWFNFDGASSRVQQAMCYIALANLDAVDNLPHLAITSPYAAFILALKFKGTNKEMTELMSGMDLTHDLFALPVVSREITESMDTFRNLPVPTEYLNRRRLYLTRDDALTFAAPPSSRSATS